MLWLTKAVLFSLLIFGALARSPLPSAMPRVELKRVPENGIQPQVAASSDGTIHLVYFKGDALGGDLFYTHSSDGERYSKSIRVNSVQGTAIATGNIRGARIATGRRGAVYVTWNGSQSAARSNGGRTPMLYTRLNKAHTAFEPERNLIQSAYGIDGGGGIAADQAGRVFVFWHSPGSESEGEQARRVWMTRSENDGQTFETERVAWNEPTGVCGCCSLNTVADETGRLYVLFRSAREMVHRDMYLLKSDDHGNTFTGLSISPWTVGYCVMSTEAFAMGSDGVLAAWETETQIRFGHLTKDGTKASESQALAGNNQKYPSLAENRRGFTLVSWTERMGWKHGGSLHWQLLDRLSHQVGEAGAADGVPVWSFLASYARRNGTFVLFY